MGPVGAQMGQVGTLKGPTCDEEYNLHILLETRCRMGTHPIGSSNTYEARGVLLLAKGHLLILSLITNRYDAHWCERSTGEGNVESL